MNKRQIPFLHWTALSPGRYAADWKPSKRLRNLGWQGRRLGFATGPHAPDAQPLVAAALALNAQLAEWEAGRNGGQDPAAPRRRTFGDAVDAYQRSPDWAGLAPKTQQEYRSRLKSLRRWALDGTLPLDQLDTGMVRDLRNALLEPAADGTPASLHVAGAMMRVLRLLLNWCIGQGWLVHNATDRVRIKQAAPRMVLLQEDQVEAAAATADAQGFPAIALAFRLDLWMFQRAGDVRALSRLSWREIEDCAPADRAVLAGPPGPTHGKVMGFRLRQGKTGAWVDCPVPPALHAAVEAAFARSDWLVPDDADLSRPCPSYLFTRRARRALNAAGLAHAQFRDLRRSGMCMFRDLGVSDPTPISGHMILGKRTILDTYMPGHTRAACAAMAHALRTRAARQKLEREA